MKTAAPRPAIAGIAIGTALLLLAATDVPAAPQGSRAAAGRQTADARMSQLSAHLETWMEQAVVPGLQIAVVRDGKPFWQAALGVARAGTDAPVTDDSVFEAASLSKPVFAYAVLKLADEGRIDLDTPLTTYMPGPYDLGDDVRVQKITARLVLSHRTGFPNWRPDGKPLTIQFTPGERFSYSGEGYVYLAAVVERITGQTLDAFISRTVFQPLGMKSSSYVWQQRYESLKVYNHDLLGRPSGRSRRWRANAAASLHTTAHDYARFVAAVISGTGLRPSTVRQMLGPQSRPDEAGPNTISSEPTGRTVPALAWGLGWGLEQAQGEWSIWHWGDNGDTRAFVAASPSRKVGVVLFANSRNGLSVVSSILSDVLGSGSAALAWLKQPGFAPSWGRFVQAVVGGDVTRALDDYRASRKANPADTPIGEEAMNSVGYVLLRDKKVKAAIEVLRQNAADHPESWNVHDSLGEAYVADDDKALATASYRRSLELNPRNAGAIEALKKLQAGQ